tara:strand:- start:802 stop:924 length:123 start_codon:yes stop_codon:yes gene_type:complete
MITSKPEKWAIQVTANNQKIVSKWRYDNVDNPGLRIINIK